MKLISPPTALLLAAAAGAAFVATGAASPSAAAPAPTAVTLQTVAQTATTPDATTPAGKTGHRRGALAGRGLHADFVVKGKAGTFITAASQRGDVSAVSPASITLKSEDGFTRTYVILPTTKVTQDKAPVALDALKTGTKASLVAVKVGDAYDVRHISVPKS